MSDLEASVKEENPPPYIIFVVVFFFFLTGLGGFLICHLLKKKGYRCHVEDDEEEEEKIGEDKDDDDEENQDTVEQILKCIIENEANMEAFNEMLGNRNVCVRHDPRLRKESIGGIPPHLHTVHSGTDHNTCHLCAQSRSKKGRRPSRTPRFKQRPGEQTVFSVGRFRVTHTDKKNLDSRFSRVPDVLVGSGDHLDQSQDSDDRKDGGYNLRNMFKDVRSPSESANGVPPVVGKRKKSLTLFGLRRGSDPIGVRVVSTGRDGVKFIPQPVVLEEPQNENGENGTKPISKLRSESLRKTAVQNQASAVKLQDKNFIAVDVEDSSQGTNLKPKLSPSTLASAPNSLPISLSPSPKPSSRMESEEIDEQFDPGPLQTSTPLSPLPDPGKGIGQFTAESRFEIGLPGTQTPPDPCTSPVQEQSSFASPALISLGSSPHSSIRTPTSPLAVTPSPKFSSKGAPKLTSSPKFTSNPSQTSSLSLSLQDDASSLEPTAQEPCLEGSAPTSKTKSQTELKDSTAQQSNGKPELKNLRVLEVDRSSPQLSPSSPLGGRISSVTIVKASPDSKREFSVVTMVEGASDRTPNVEVQQVDHSGTEVKWTLGEDKDDIVEMEDIKECKVTRDEEVEKLNKIVTTEVTQD